MKNTLLVLFNLLLILHANAQSNVGNFSVLRDFSLYFDSGKSVLKPEATQVLDSVFTQITQNNSLKAYIIAYTDSVGTEKSNLKLSQKRAEAMVNYLREKGVAAEKIMSDYKGELEGNDLGLNRKGRVILLGIEQAIKLKEEKQVVNAPPPPLHIKGVVTDIKTKMPIPNVQIKAKTDKAEMQMLTDKNGNYELILEGDSISISASIGCYFFVVNNFRRVNNPNKEINIQLEKMRKGAKLPLKDIVFVGDKADFLPEAMPTLARLYELMNENPHLKVEIGGHINGAAMIPFKYQFNTNPDTLAIRRYDETHYIDNQVFLGVKTDEDKFFLSLDRAREVRNYLRNKGIDNERITYRGYSGTQQKYNFPKNPEQEKMNRRVEITVTESDCE